MYNYLTDEERDVINKVGDYPEEFIEWVKANAERIGAWDDIRTGMTYLEVSERHAYYVASSFLKETGK